MRCVHIGQDRHNNYVVVHVLYIKLYDRSECTILLSIILTAGILF